MHIEILAWADCPHRDAAGERVRAALACLGVTGPTVVESAVSDEKEAARLGMAGSPTILVDGVDPFAALAAPAVGTVSCRLYRHGSCVAGVPTVDQLCEVLRP